MKKKLHLDIYNEGILLAILARTVAKNNNGKEPLTLSQIDSLILSLEKECNPEIDIVTKYREPFELCVYENDVLVCMISEREMYSLEQRENAVLNCHDTFKLEQFLKD